MPLFEIETDSHIIITWAADEASARAVLVEAYPNDSIVRLTKRPRDSWVISKGALGVAGTSNDICATARDCLSKASGDKLHAIRRYMSETGVDLGGAPVVVLLGGLAVSTVAAIVIAYRTWRDDQRRRRSTTRRRAPRR